MILELLVVVCVQVGVQYFFNDEERSAPPDRPPDKEGEGGEVEVIERSDSALTTSRSGAVVALSKSDSVEAAVSIVPATPAATAQNGIPLSIASLGLALVTRGPLRLLSTALISYTIAPIYAKAWQQWKNERRFSNETLFCIFSSLALIAQYNAAIAFGYVAYELGSYLLRKTSAQAQKLAFDGFSQLPRHAWLLVDDVTVQVPLSKLQVGDVVVVHSGEIVPVDGEIVKGHAPIDQHQLTGEAQPTEKQEGDTVLASTLVTAGTIHVKIKQTGHNTTVAQIAQTLTALAQTRTAVQSRSEQLADRTVLPTLALSGAAFFVGGLPMAIVILNSSFANRIRVLGPLSTLNYLTIAAQKGILVKSGTALEQLRRVDTVLFDKTGTLTLPELKAGRVAAQWPFDEQQVLSYAAAAERRQGHPIAQAILQAARDQQLDIPDYGESDYRIGYGVLVKLADGTEVRVGSVRFLEKEGLAMPEHVATDVRQAQEAGESLVVVAVNDNIAGTILIQAQVRPEVPTLISGLRGRGVKKMALVSGDHAGATAALATSLDINEYFAEVLPTDKASIVRKLQEEGRVVCFIGDGINDSVAMQQADVSVSLSGAATIATDSASVVLMSGGLEHLCELFDIANKLDRNVRTSIGLLAASSVLNIGGAFVFGLGVNASVLVKAVTSLAAVGNSALPLTENAQGRTSEKAEVAA